MIRRPPRSTLSSSSAASDVYKRQYQRRVRGKGRQPMSRPAMDIKPHSRLGRGAFGECWLVHNEAGEGYAMKQIVVTGMNRKERTKTLDEVTILSKLYHPSVIKCYDAWVMKSKDGARSLCILMELGEGGDLAAAISRTRGQGFDERIALPWLQQLSSALAYIHRHKVIHRDLKPANILLGAGGTAVKIADFGIATVQQYTMAEAVTRIGTLMYMAPEMIFQQNGQRGYSSSVDVWALGCVCHELLTGRVAFAARTMAELVNKIQRPRPPELAGTRHTSADLKALVRTMLAKDATRRPTAAQVMAIAASTSPQRPRSAVSRNHNSTPAG
eukprot:TRINITY_DN4483_c0_g1_i4.p1 TRINITY_DN4483_c0_g1~~TRINITY_DN4483_c0_g1_i4.p1  ORF type:complete len:329 (-),score=62.52 TRINITY_DN4483_c0_g1_i4:536-1522(-)